MWTSQSVCVVLYGSGRPSRRLDFKRFEISFENGFTAKVSSPAVFSPTCHLPKTTHLGCPLPILRTCPAQTLRRWRALFNDRTPASGTVSSMSISQISKLSTRNSLRRLNHRGLSSTARSVSFSDRSPDGVASTVPHVTRSISSLVSVHRWFCQNDRSG